LNHRELAMMVPLAVLVFWIGFFPNPLVSRMHASVMKTIDLMSRTRVAPAIHPSAGHGLPAAVITVHQPLTRESAR
jgi:NADH-quinone oxidoreductase subunit M